MARARSAAAWLLACALLAGLCGGAAHSQSQSQSQSQGLASALFRACRNGDRVMVSLLLLSNTSVNAQDQRGREPLAVAAKHGRADLVQLLLRRHAALEAQDWEGRRALHWAAYKGRGKVVDILLEQHAELEAQDKEGRQALHWAAYKGHVNVVEKLLERGAELEAQDNNGRRALHLAAEEGHLGMVDYLVRHNASTHARDAAGFCVADLAGTEGHLTVVSLLPKCRRSGWDWLCQAAASREFWGALALAAVMVCASLRFRRDKSSDEDDVFMAGSACLAARAVYPWGALLGVQLFRAGEVLSNTVLPMFLMLQVLPALWCAAMLLVYGIPVLRSWLSGRLNQGKAKLERPVLLLVSPRQSLLHLGHWEGRCGSLGLLKGPARLGLLLALHHAITTRPHDSLWHNKHGGEALKVIEKNPRSDLCLPLPQLISQPLKQQLWLYRPPWRVAEGGCSLEKASLCITSPNYPGNYTREGCLISVLQPAGFRIHVDAFDTQGTDFLLLAGRNFSGRLGPSGEVPNTDIYWVPTGGKEGLGWKICPSHQICFRSATTVGDLWSVLRAVSKWIAAVYSLACIVLALVPLALALPMRCAHERRTAVARVATEILSTLGRHPAPDNAAAAVSRVEGLGGRLVQPTSVRATALFLLLDFLLDINTVRVLLLNEDYFFAAIIAAVSISSTLAELRQGRVSEVTEAIGETQRTGVPTAAYMRLVGSERVEAFVSLLVTSYAMPFAARSPMDLTTTSFSLLTSSWSLASYILEELDIGRAVELDTESSTSETSEDESEDSSSPDEKEFLAL